ncbi:MAG: DUF998 domain-containing protein [Nostocoides sp.]
MPVSRAFWMRTAVVSASASVIALVGGWTWAAASLPGFDPSAESISALAASDTPHRSIMTAALVITGIGYLVTAAALVWLPRRGRYALAGAGLATLAVAALPLPTRGGASMWHTAAAAAAFGLLSLWPVLAATGRPVSDRDVTADAPARGHLLTAPAATAATAVLGVGSLTLATPMWGDAFGLGERLVAAATALWPLAVGLDQWWAAGHRIGTRRTRQVLGAIALTLGCSVAGVLATTVAPATVQVGNYAATVSLNPDLRRANELDAVTTLGDVRVEFVGFAPGITLTPQVLASFADDLDAGLSIDRLRPDTALLNRGAETAVSALAWRFAIGAVGLSVLVLGGTALVRRRRPTQAGVVIGVVAASAALITMAVAVRGTYQMQRQRTYTATELLGTFQRNLGMLKDVQARADEATPYLRNLLALSTSLQQTYASPSLEADPSLRLLAVSDIHDGNSYALLRTIIKNQSVDAVIDSGDLVTFGTVEEGEAAGLFDGIASLGVPYLFIQGNHDSTSPTDTAVRDRLARIPNVILLQPDARGYQEVSIGGIRIAGFNDPRYYGDSGRNTAAAQTPAREAFAGAYAERAEPDVVAGHEPAAVAGISAGVLINGHMHTPDLEGNRIQVGTLTGGGPFSHFISQGDGEELAGQPSAFDVLTFSAQCRLSSLTRFQFRGIYEGRPTYDDVVLINGSRIDTRPVDPDRTCAPGGLTITPVPAIRNQLPPG